MSTDRREADDLREEMGRLDAQILTALEKRARAARRLGDLRRDQAPVLPLADHAAIREILSKATGEMPEDALRAVFGEIYSACLALELPVRVAVAGPETAPVHAAARGRFGLAANLVAAETTAGALDEVSRKHAEFAVLPFETATDGPVHATLLALSAIDLRVVEVLERDGVRYAVIGTRPSGRTGNDVTAIVFSVRDSPGALLDVLRVFGERAINLTNVHSHPVQGEAWTYLFYVEMAGHFTDRAVVTALEEMRRQTRFFKLLGSYPAP